MQKGKTASLALSEENMICLATSLKLSNYHVKSYRFNTEKNWRVETLGFKGENITRVTISWLTSLPR